jgi:hypothetical protein
MNPPLCPRGHGSMKLVHITQGDIDLGYAWFCVNDDGAKPDYCDECEDAGSIQLELELGAMP